MEKLYQVPTQKFFFRAAFIFAISGTALLFWLQKPELAPQLWTSIAVALFSFWACRFTADKLRLDLWHQRFEIYQNTLTYSSTVLAYASLDKTPDNADQIDKAIAAAHESFRGIGRQKAMLLFGPDVIDEFEKLSRSFAYISIFSKYQGTEHFKAKEYWFHVNQTVEISEALPKLLKPYMYFGNYKEI